MAEKEKKNRVMDVLLKEHKWENLVLAILAVFAIELGVLLLSKTYLTMYFKKSSSISIKSFISAKAISGSIIQNSFACVLVFEFSVLNVGPKV